MFNLGLLLYPTVDQFWIDALLGQNLLAWFGGTKGVGLARGGS